MKPIRIILLALALALFAAGCGSAAPESTPEAPSGVSEPQSGAPADPDGDSASGEGTFQPADDVLPSGGEADSTPAQTAELHIGESVFPVELADTGAAGEFAGLLEEGDLTLTLEDYSGFEKVGPLGQALTASDSRIAAAPGDIMLYQGNQIVLFYGSNTWAYTRIGRLTDCTGLEEALGNGSVTVRFARTRTETTEE